MSKFFQVIDKVFQNQLKSKDFEPKSSFKDKTFHFDIKDKEKNCILTDKTIYNKIEKAEINKAIHIIYNIFDKYIKEKWIKNYKYIGKKFDMTKLEDYYKKYTKANTLSIAQSVIEKEFKEGKEHLDDGKISGDFNFQKYCFVNEYINRNDEKSEIESTLKIYNEIFEYKSLRKIKKKKNKLFENELNCTYANQGELGDCYFIEALSILSNYGQLIYQLFPKEDIPSDGIFTVCLFINGEWQKVLIDDYFFFIKGTDDFAFTQPVNNCIYTCVLEKAFAKTMGSFSAINGGNNEMAFKVLTGFESLTYPNKIIDSNFINFYHKKLKSGYLFSCNDNGHAYSLLNIYCEGKQVFLQYRNPWGKNTPEQKELAKIDEYSRKCLTIQKDKKKVDKIDNKDENNINENNNIIKNDIKNIIKYNEVIKEKENGIYLISLKYFKEKFLSTTICQILFNSTIYSYKINLEEISGSFLYFQIEIEEDTEFGISLYQNSIIENQVYYKEDTKEDSKYIRINIANTLKTQLSLENKNDFNPETMDYFHFIKSGSYKIKINIEQSERNSTLLINLIIKGQKGQIFYLKDNENNNKNNNLNATINYNRYVYGERTGLLFETFRNMIDFLEKYHNIKFIENGRGYYVETIFTNEVKTLVFTNKNDMKDIIGSINNNDKDFILTGFEHENGKIKGKGAIKDLKNNIIKEFIFKDNKIYKYDFNLKKEKDVSELVISLISNHNILDNNGLNSIEFCMDAHKLFLKIKTDWKCNFCKKSFQNCNCFYCDICTFFLCLDCLNKYLKIMFEKIIEVHIGFKKIGLPVQGLTDTLLFIPRMILPSNPLTHKVNILASLLIKTLKGTQVMIEFGDYKGEDIKDKNNKIYTTYYWNNEKNGLRFAEISYDDYKNNILDYDKYSERIFELIPLKNMSLIEVLEECNFNDKNWNLDSYNKYFNNSKDFVAEFIRVADCIREEDKEHRGYHNYSKTVIPKVILDAIEKNENDQWNKSGSLPLIGPLIGVFHFIGDKITK